MNEKEEPRTAVFHLFGHVGRPNPDDQDGEEKSFFSLETIMEDMKHILEGSEAHRRCFRPVLVISSHGGFTEESLRIHAYLSSLPIELTTIGVGIVESAATIVYLAGKHRLATPTTSFMLHEARRSVRSATTEELKNIWRKAVSMDKLHEDIIAKATGKHGIRWMRGEHRLSAEAAMKHGIVHEITDKVFSGDVLFSEHLRHADFL